MSQLTSGDMEPRFSPLINAKNMKYQSRELHVPTRASKNPSWSKTLSLPAGVTFHSSQRPKEAKYDPAVQEPGKAEDGGISPQATQAQVSWQPNHVHAPMWYRSLFLVLAAATTISSHPGWSPSFGICLNLDCSGMRLWAEFGLPSLTRGKERDSVQENQST